MAKRRKKNQVPPLIWGIIIVLVAGALLVGRQVWLAEKNAIQTEQTDASRQAAQTEAQRRAFIKSHAPYAQSLQRAYGILPSITLAQAILESNWGQSTLASRYHNLFGIKGSDPATSQLMTTQEFTNDHWVTVKARFRVYASDQASMKDHALLLVNGTSWNANQYQSVRTAKTYQAAAYALKSSGYATDPNYPAKLIALIEKYDLAQYDQ